MAMNTKTVEKDNGVWKVVVTPRFWDWSVEVWLVNKQGTKQFLAHFTNTGEIQLDELKEGVVEQKPTLIINRDVWQLLVDAVTEATPPTKKEVIEGILDATKFHLEDMRKIVFKKEGMENESNT